MIAKTAECPPVDVSPPAAYWLVRAFTSVALEEALLTITYAGGILRRMQERNDWSTDELMRRPKEQRAAAAAPTAAPERVARAGGTADKRALLTRFLAEHPITEEELLK